MSHAIDTGELITPTNMNLQTLHPASLYDGDILFYGSFVYENIVVDCNGVE